jgi:hypothetical protein
MVKNNTGGNKSKGFARKNLVKRDTALRVAKEEGEIYAQAVKILGGSIASVIDIEGNTLRAHIRGKFRGRGKRDNFIGPGTWLLVGLHDWQSSSKPGDVRDCDILEVYNDNDKNRLKNSVTTINWNTFIANDSKTITSAEDEVDDSGIEFADEATQEFEQLIAAQAKGKNTIIMEEGDEIDVDEI